MTSFQHVFEGYWTPPVYVFFGFHRILLCYVWSMIPSLASPTQHWELISKHNKEKANESCDSIALYGQAVAWTSLTINILRAKLLTDNF